MHGKRRHSRQRTLGIMCVKLFFACLGLCVGAAAFVGIALFLSR